MPDVLARGPFVGRAPELRRLVTHEVGHALGLWNHPAPTSFPESVMLSVPSTDVPTAIDRATVQVLYHTAPNVSL